MSRVTPVHVIVLVDGVWIRGTVRTREVSPDGETCSAVVSYGNNPSAMRTVRVDPPGCATWMASQGVRQPTSADTCCTWQVQTAPDRHDGEHKVLSGMAA